MLVILGPGVDLPLNPEILRVILPGRKPRDKVSDLISTTGFGLNQPPGYDTITLQDFIFKYETVARIWTHQKRQILKFQLDEAPLLSGTPLLGPCENGAFSLMELIFLLSHRR